MSNGEDLVARIRDYARQRQRAAVAVVSSAWLAQELEADPRTIAAALRPYGIRPAEVERGVRGYLIADLAGLDLRSEPGPAQAAAAAAPGGGGVPADLPTAGAPSEDGPRPALEPVPPVSALAALSAGAGHDMAPALRAAGLL